MLLLVAHIVCRVLLFNQPTHACNSTGLTHMPPPVLLLSLPLHPACPFIPHESCHHTQADAARAPSEGPADAGSRQRKNVAAAATAAAAAAGLPSERSARASSPDGDDDPAADGGAAAASEGKVTKGRSPAAPEPPVGRMLLAMQQQMTQLVKQDQKRSLDLVSLRSKVRYRELR